MYVPESVDTLKSSSELCSRSDADEVLEQGRSLTKDEVLACQGKSPTVPEVLCLLTAKVERDVSESDPPISKDFPVVKRSSKI